jgi:ABC-type antimicrobial peptide transport system permease subunit
MNSALYLCKELWLGIKAKGLKASIFAASAIGLFLCFATICLLAWNLLGLNKDDVLYALFKEMPDKNLPDQLENLISGNELVTQLLLDYCEPRKKCELPEDVRRSFSSNTNPLAYFRIIVKSSQDIPKVETAMKIGGLDQYLNFVIPSKGSLKLALSQNVALQNLFILLLLVAFSLATIVVIWAFRELAVEWAPELETLFLSGIEPQSLRLPFFLTGILFGLAASFVALLVFYLLQLLSAPLESPLRQWLPDLLHTDFLAHLFWRLLGLGLLAGVLIGGLAALGLKLKSN